MTSGIFVLCMALIILVVLAGMIVGTKHIVKARRHNKAPSAPPPPAATV